MPALPEVNWNYPTPIWFGEGRVKELPAACAELGMRRPLLVTDEGLAALPMVQEALDGLIAAQLEAALFSDVQGNPTGSNVEKGLAVFRQGQHDGVVAFGGGSGLDAGKAIALMAGQSRSLWDFEDVGDNWRRADASGIAPVIAIPTTAGTGSEVGRASVILDETAQRKKIIFHPAMLPGLVISDPGLTLALPPTITAWTGVDAFVHALEAFCAPAYHPMADGIAVEAMRLVKAFLPRAVADGTDIEARGQMLVAASMGATAFQKGLGSIHAVSHVVGALYNTHHGLTNAIVLPFGVRQNAPVLEEKLSTLCRVLSLKGEGSEAFVAFLHQFCSELAIPASLSELGVDDSRAEEIGGMALQDPSAGGNAQVLTAQQYTALFRASVAGDVSFL
ncbi:MAG: iron-containing alcohol dehydrogenase [Pseudomonadota bacterium]